jgi:hypothetical protein
VRQLNLFFPSVVCLAAAAAAACWWQQQQQQQQQWGYIVCGHCGVLCEHCHQPQATRQSGNLALILVGCSLLDAQVTLNTLPQWCCTAATCDCVAACTALLQVRCQRRCTTPYGGSMLLHCCHRASASPRYRAPYTESDKLSTSASAEKGTLYKVEWQTKSYFHPALCSVAPQNWSIYVSGRCCCRVHPLVHTVLCIQVLSHIRAHVCVDNGVLCAAGWCGCG